jgi:hypothetical protein
MNGVKHGNDAWVSSQCAILPELYMLKVGPPLGVAAHFAHHMASGLLICHLLIEPADQHSLGTYSWAP